MTGRGVYMQTTCSRDDRELLQVDDMNEMDPSPRPAQDTKHLAVLSYPFLDARFSLRQLDDGQANGTALWLGAQCLSLYLPSLLSSPRTHHTNPRPAALDLGSGIGLTAYVPRPSPAPAAAAPRPSPLRFQAGPAFFGLRRSRHRHRTGHLECPPHEHTQ